MEQVVDQVVAAAIAAGEVEGPYAPLMRDELVKLFGTCDERWGRETYGQTDFWRIGDTFYSLA